MTSTLEPPAATLPAVTQDRPGETTLVLRIRGAEQNPWLPAGNYIAAELLRTVLQNELDAEGIHYSHVKGGGPLNIATFLVSTSEPRRAARRLAAVLESHLGSFFTVHVVDRRRNLLRCLRAIPYLTHLDAATLDDLRAEVDSTALGKTIIAPTLLQPGGRVMDYILDAVTRAERAAAEAARNQKPETGTPGDTPPAS